MEQLPFIFTICNILWHGNNLRKQWKTEELPVKLGHFHPE